MPQININGIIVDFPFEPYDVQKVYMSKVIECLQQKKNGVLESPTGTGKTLCLLCSSLAWLVTKKAQMQAQALSGAKESSDFSNRFLNRLEQELKQGGGSIQEAGAERLTHFDWVMPKIIYASRTHSQLSQVMQELKRTTYNHVKVAVIGSRDQLCIHPEVSRESNAADKIHLCQLKIRTRTCFYYNNVESRKDDPMFKDNICDIEDLIKAGNKSKCCPYFMAKELKQNADIIFMPYNYLIDPKTRRSQGIELQNSIILLDEAHNVEKICEEAASLEVSSTDVAICIDEITSVMKTFDEESAQNDGERDFDNGFDSGVAPKDFTAEDLYILKSMFLSLEKAIDEIAMDESEGKIFPGNYIFELLKKAELTKGKETMVADKLDKIILWLSTTSASPFTRNGRALQKFSDFLRIVFDSAPSTDPRFTNRIKDCYKVYVKPESAPKRNQSNSWDRNKTAKKADGKIVNYWCLSPGYSMRQLSNSGIHSIILTSGTLSPLKPFISELGMTIDVQLENPHIVDCSQICIGILGQGPDGYQLNCSYNTRNDPKYIDSLGRTISNLSGILPDGVLVFFPSYPIMTKYKEHWQNSGIWSSIAKKKTIFVEPQTKSGFNNVINEYYEKIKDQNCRGAIFLAICRGKVSEGLDFADANGRAVLIVGLPYPPMMDPHVKLKQKYLDEMRMEDKDALPGSQWYQLEASRAVNQAIGRVIRHINDYGAIVLCDCRFNNANFKSHLSAWLRPHIKNYTNFGVATKVLSNFFKKITIDSPHSTKYTEIENETVAKTAALANSEKQFYYHNDNVDVNFYTSTAVNSVDKNVAHPVADKTIPKEIVNADDSSSSKASINFVTTQVKGKWSETISAKKCESTKNIGCEPVAKKRKLKISPIDINYCNDPEISTSSIKELSNSENASEMSKKCDKEKIKTNSDTNKKEKIGENYLKLVKKSLSKEDFKIFQEMIAAYNKYGDFDKLINMLQKLFLDTCPNGEPLFMGFKAFLKKNHVDQFLKIVQKYDNK